MRTIERSVSVEVPGFAKGAGMVRSVDGRRVDYAFAARLLGHRHVAMLQLELSIDGHAMVLDDLDVIFADEGLGVAMVRLSGTTVVCGTRCAVEVLADDPPVGEDPFVRVRLVDVAEPWRQWTAGGFVPHADTVVRAR